jgi:hypothetical protein
MKLDHSTMESPAGAAAQSSASDVDVRRQQRKLWIIVGSLAAAGVALYVGKNFMSKPQMPNMAIHWKQSVLAMPTSRWC